MPQSLCLGIENFDIILKFAFKAVFESSSRSLWGYLSFLTALYSIISLSFDLQKCIIGFLIFLTLLNTVNSDSDINLSSLAFSSKSATRALCKSFLPEAKKNACQGIFYI